ncbi:hypothetical protein ACHAXR_009165, partial [Thalassiosira sp. AJA248-18]
MITTVGSHGSTQGGGGVNSTNPNNNSSSNDPYLSDDFHPLSLASSEILSALRADESAPDADLYRRLISSSGVGAHRYHVAQGEDGCGEVGSGGGGGSSPSGGGGGSSSSGSRGQPSSSSSPGNVIGSPLGVLRGSRQYGNKSSTETTNTTTNTSTTPSNNNKSISTSSPPTSYLKHDKSLPLPPHLAAEAKKAQLSSLMGLLPEANLVWLSADEKLYLWSYKGGVANTDTNNNAGGGGGGLFGSPFPSSGKGTGGGSGGYTNSSEDYCSFTVPSGQCIVSIGLVRAKPGVFTSNVQWCLVVTTPEEAILCALANERCCNDGDSAAGGGEGGNGNGFRHGNDSILRLIPTRFVLPTDGVPLVSICGSKDGRIFLGGCDGNLYEMSYEGNLPSNNGGGSGGGGTSLYGGVSSGSEVMERAIDNYFDGQGVFTLDGNASLNGKRNNWSVNGALSGGKRVLSALSFGSLDDTTAGGPPLRSRKCRKINHSSSAPTLVSSVVPGAVVRIASGIFGSSLESAAKKGGPIVSLLLDEERLCLYTLGSRGVVCTYDVAPLPNASVSDSSGSGNAPAAGPPRLASVIDLPSTSKLYLDSVSRGRMYPPTSQSIALGTITFPGGIGSAEAGVGGMEGARDILKKFDLEGRMIKAATATNSGGAKGLKGELNNNTAGILNPVSIHLIPTSQSKSLTLVAITGGGLRYYLSSLSSSYINSAQSGGLMNYGGPSRGGQVGGGTRSGGLDPRLARMRPGRKVIFCHIRAPPPYTTSGNEGNDGLRFELAPSAVNLFSGSVGGGGGGGGGLPPGIHNVGAGGAGGRSGGGTAAAAGDVVKGCYGNGMFVLALDVEKGKSGIRGGPSSSNGNSFFSTPSSEGRSSSSKIPGDAILVTLPDFAARAASSSQSISGVSNMHTVGGSSSSLTTINNVTPGGISETILLPMSGLGGTTSPVLPGGRTFDIVNTSGRQQQSSKLATLFVKSETPSDVELQLGLLPSFTPLRKKQLPQYKKLNSQSNSNTASSALISTDGGRGMISSALSALSYYVRSGAQGHGHEVGTVSQGSNGFGPSITYRVSYRHGCDSSGFSNSASESGGVIAATSSSRMRQQRSSPSSSAVVGKGGATTTAKSARLPSWLLCPSAAPLNTQASQHLTPAGGSSSGSSGSILILNSGGLHFFTNSTLLNNLATVLQRANNVAKDALVKNFFVSYGYVEGCAMCFALATSTASSVALRKKAEQAVMCFAHQPVMKLIGGQPSSSAGGNNGMLDPMTSYSFQPSSMYEGLVKFTSRLLRPFWYKPAVVVTEGRPIRTRSAYANYYAALPAKVELLLDDKTLDEIRRPLVLLQSLMKNTFVPAVKSIPGVSNKGSGGNMNDAMDVDDEQGNNSGGLITRAMQNQSRAAAAAQRMNNAAANGQSNQQYAVTQAELQRTAFRTEERHMHSLYRLLSRCVQLLDLLSSLKGAHSMPALPEVQWGLLHGLTFYQLVTSSEGQGRIETLLNALVSQCEKTTLVNGMMSSDGDLLAETLSRKCYLFFSSASRLTFLGFRSANDALSRPLTSPQRGVLANQAASYLRSASRHWHAPTLIAGRLLSISNNNGDAVSWEDVVTNAMESGSPLALAADILMKLGHVEGLADVCLICASNFGGAKVARDERKELGEDTVEGMLSWERGLYHRPPPTDTVAGGSSGGGLNSRSATTILTGMDVTPSDALQTCHSIIFHYISKLLGEGRGSASSNQQRLAEELVATCAASLDVKFLHSLYEHLLATNQVETALRIDSTSLEKWLLETKKDVGLLWKYYSFHERNVLAGDIMWKRATESEEKIPLDQRIECLTRAANSFASALQANHSSSSTLMRRLVGGGISGQGGATSQALQDPSVTVDTLQTRITQIQEQLDVATIQKRVLTTITQSQDTNIGSEKMDALTSTLVTVSAIYNEYACPLNLFDVCLLILETCHHKEVDSIHTLWKSIICEEIIPCSTHSQFVLEFLTRLKQGSLLEEETIVFGGGEEMKKFENGEWIPRLKNRVAALGRELYGKGADYTFPLDAIVRELEGE